ncbi:MBL fold metallo-hydrolase [Candidatus Lokiarchaeum ossiferum]|uniref:MBL fold metallo-hydrolase n=1 Tax=Candidatus Lokiarchaeum ossiferum TaxID=2951803 RepID=UPI00352C45C0
MIKKVAMIRFGSLGINFGETPSHELYQFKKKLGICGESSVTLLQTDQKNILLDTGFKNEGMLSPKNIAMNQQEMKHLLGYHSLTPEKIDEIFITHWHHDHFGNLTIFPNASLFFAGVSEKYVMQRLAKIGMTMDIFQLKSNTEWHEGISTLATPGHNKSHHSIIINYNEKCLICAGDAIVAKGYYDFDEIYPYNGDFYSKKIALQSMHAMIQRADIIIPGHDQPFQNWRKKNIDES